MAEIQIYIATYNRPKTVLVSVNSVLAQTFKSFELIVSDNSDNNETQSILSNIKDEKFKYIKRKVLYTGLEHLNLILSEITANYFMIFHDDDVMHPGMVGKLQSFLNDNSNIVAVGANARKVKNGKLTNLFLHSKNDILIKSPKELVIRYLIKNGIVPFPSYMYRLDVAKNLKLNTKNGGKYCDVSFLMDVTTLGPIKFLSMPLMDYYIHSGQDSSANESLQKATLINYIVKKAGIDRNSRLMKKYRMYNFYVEFRTLKKEMNYSKRRLFEIYCIFFRWSPFKFFPKVLKKSILNSW
jgi:glycosyltransferase involved in cell wall biosynthesis